MTLPPVTWIRVDRVHLEHFRAASALEVVFERDVTVLVGRNGVGKTTILDALAVMLSALAANTRAPTSYGRTFRALDIRNGEKQATVALVVEHPIDSQGPEGRNTTMWRRSVGLPPRPRHEAPVSVRLLAERLAPALEDRVQVPVMVYYPVNRAVLDVPLRIRTRHQFTPVDAWEGALDGAVGAVSTFRVFFEWFREREDLENQQARRKASHSDAQLDAVRSAITQIMPGFEAPRVERSPLRMLLTKNNRDVVVNQLSDGEKCLLSLGADLARRLAIANPRLPDPLSGSGVVLIDEVDLHLHPGWQRTVIPALRKTFPNCQFVVSTHSPQVLASVEGRCVRAFEMASDGTLSLSAPVSPYGHDSNYILESLLSVDERPPEIKAALADIHQAIRDNLLDVAKTKRDELLRKVGPMPALDSINLILRKLSRENETHH